MNESRGWTVLPLLCVEFKMKKHASLTHFVLCLLSFKLSNNIRTHNLGHSSPCPTEACVLFMDSVFLDFNNKI